MAYISHRPTYAVDGAFFRVAAGRIEVWEIFHFPEGEDLNFFNQRLFVIPVTFLGMFVANLKELKDAFYDGTVKDEARDVTPKCKRFGQNGFVDGE